MDLQKSDLFDDDDDCKGDSGAQSIPRRAGHIDCSLFRCFRATLVRQQWLDDFHVSFHFLRLIVFIILTQLTVAKISF